MPSAADVPSGLGLVGGEFSRMDIHRKKNGKIKKIVLRNSTNLFYQVEPHNRDLFISHIMRLVPGINSIERKATWHS